MKKEIKPLDAFNKTADTINNAFSLYDNIRRLFSVIAREKKCDSSFLDIETLEKIRLTCQSRQRLG